MTESEIRQMVVEAMDAASAFGLRDGNLTEAFLGGTGDASFETLEMDSLAMMELCIAIEVNSGVSIVPDDLPVIGTLQGLVQRIGGALK